MTSPAQLVPGAPPPTPLHLEEVGPGSAPLIRTLYNRIWATSGRSAWSDEQWTEELSLPGIRTWIAHIDNTIAGFAELSPEPAGDVGIVVFGLVPEFQSKGYGGALSPSPPKPLGASTPQPPASGYKPPPKTTRTPSPTTKPAASRSSPRPPRASAAARNVRVVIAPV
jgi:hypothetical protein